MTFRSSGITNIEFQTIGLVNKVLELYNENAHSIIKYFQFSIIKNIKFHILLKSKIFNLFLIYLLETLQSEPLLLTIERFTKNPLIKNSIELELKEIHETVKMKKQNLSGP